MVAALSGSSRFAAVASASRFLTAATPGAVQVRVLPGGVAAAVAVRDPEVKGKVYLKSEVKINGQECAFYTSETDGVGNLALG